MDKTRGILGLANLGNTCFMNATLQALRHSPEWTLFCTQGKIKEHISEPEKSCSIMLLAYQDLLMSIWGGSGPGYVKPLDFYNKLRSTVKGCPLYEIFIQRSPQDAHEFLVWLLDQMYMATQKEVNITIKDTENLQPMVLKAVEGWKSSFEKQYSPLTDLVFGMYRIQYLCTACGVTHSRWETFNVLKIHPGHESIEAALKHEFKEEDIDDYECDECNKQEPLKPGQAKPLMKKSLAKKTVSIWRLPKLLIITLKRFTPMGPRDNSPFAYDGGPINFGNNFSQESHEDSKFKQYKVFATVDHHGSHMGGHYTAQCFSPVWKQWHLYDDEAAHSIEEPRFGVYTYMLFLRY